MPLVSPRMNTFNRRTVMAAGASISTLLAIPHSHVLARQETDPLAGTVVTALSGGAPAVIPERMLLLLRVTMEVGAEIPAHSHPGPVALYVDAGTFGSEFVEGQGTVTRAETGTATPATVIDMAPGDDIVMEVGDHLFYDGAVHTMRNDGEEQLVLLVAALFDPNEPGFMFMDM